MKKGIRMIKAREYLLNGRFFEKEDAVKELRRRIEQGRIVKLIKYSDYDYALFEHGVI